ncbi:MAG TPA: DUF72 domain-containing protein [Terriglobales bacterium]|nr:DUF72 domain-containing protein [Terriglobales bacterium]
MAARIFIGTSGWHYKHWLGNFYPAKLPASKMLAHYLQHFDTVELNNSFYRLPNIETLEAWRKNTPKDFVFAVKGSRFITHNKKLKEPHHALENLLPRIDVLKKKLGPILFQLPPAWRLNELRLEEFLHALPKYHRYTFEFREPSWHTPRVLELLREYRASYCVYDIGGYHSPIEVTTDFAYIRLHGPGDKYQGSYSHEALARWAAWIHDWSSRLTAIYIYFDNDQAGYAAQNALTLKRLIAEAQPLAA